MRSIVQLSVFVAALVTVVHVAIAQTPIASQIAALPDCFIGCANKTAVSPSVGCTSVSDFDCLCKKDDFPKAVATCIASSGESGCSQLAQNQTAITNAASVFQQICSSVSGASGGMGNMTGMAGANATAGANKTTSGTATGNKTTNGTAASGTNVAHATVAPPVQHVVAAAAVIMSVLLASVATLL